MGGGTNTVVQQTGAQQAQGQILQALAPYLQAQGQATLPLQTQLQTSQLIGQNSIMPQLQSMLTAAGSGAPTSQQQQNITGVQQQQRQQAANMGIAPTDPRMNANFQQAGQQATMGNMPELQTIMSLFGSGQGLNAGNTLSMMGQGASAGQSTTNNPSITQQLGSGASTLGLLAMLGNQAGLFGGAAGAGAGLSAADMATILSPAVTGAGAAGLGAASADWLFPAALGGAAA